MKGLDLMKKYSLLDLMAIALSPIETADDASRYVQAINEILNRIDTLTTYHDMIERFIEYNDMYHTTKNVSYMIKALNIMLFYAERK